MAHNKTRINYGDQSGQLTEIRAGRPDQAVWSFSSQQATLRRLNKAFADLFARVKRGEKAGYPRFKGGARFDSVEWPKDGDGARWQPEQRRVYLRGIGQVNVHVHRQVQGRVKTIRIKRQGRRWMLVLSCADVPANPLPLTSRQEGIDVGIVSFATTSDGEHIDNPRNGLPAVGEVTIQSSADTTDVMRWMVKSRSRPDAESKATSCPPRTEIGDTTRWVATPAASR
jgi:putative transposase